MHHLANGSDRLAETYSLFSQVKFDARELIIERTEVHPYIITKGLICIKYVT